jgi:uncharacterized protein YcgL (UPF0745 family)
MITELINEIFETEKEIQKYIKAGNRQMAVAYFKSLENRLTTLRQVYPKSHRLSKIVKRVQKLFMMDLFLELEADLERYKKDGFILEVPNSESPIFKKYLELNEKFITDGRGAIFEPETAIKNYGVNFFELEFKKDYEVVPSVSIGTDIKPILSMSFTDEGIKKLLKTNQKMINEVEKLYFEENEEM